MKWWWSKYIPYVLVVTFILLICKTKETYALPIAKASDQTKQDLNGKVRPAEKSIKRTAWTNVTMTQKTKTALESIGSILNPKETVIFRAQPKYITDHAIIVGKPFTMSIEARSYDEAVKEVKKRAAEELEGINYVLRASNLVGW